MHFKKNILVLLFSLFVLTGSGQFSINKYPVRFAQYYNSYMLVNPASMGSWAPYDLSIGSQRLLGNFSKVSTSYLTASVKLSRRHRRNSPFSALGVKFYNDREGKYLNRTRFYLVYAWHAYLTSDILFSGGLELGAMNYSVKGTDLTYGGSDIVPDGAVGLQIYNKTFHFGLSMHQIFNSEIQPLEEIAVLSSYFNFDASYQFFINKDFIFSPSCFARYQIEDSKTFLDINLNFDVIKKLFLSLGIHNNSMLINTVGVSNLATQIGSFGIQFSYVYPVKKAALQTNMAEIGFVFKGKN